MSDSIKISIDLDPALQKALSDLQTRSRNVDAGLKKIGTTGSGAFSSIALQIGKTINAYDIFAGNLAANLATKAFDFIKNSAVSFFNTAIDGAAKAEQSLKNLKIALDAAGLLSKADALEDYADELQKITVYSKDAALETITLLAQLTTLDENGLKSATKASLDLAASWNISLSEASDLISKAINGNVVAFQKKGIAIEKSNSNSQMLSNTLRALSLQVDASTKSAETYSGATEIAKNQQGELFEAIGKIITQSKTVIDATQAKAKAYAFLAGWVDQNRKFITDLGTTIVVLGGIFTAGVAAVALFKTAFISMSVVLATGTTAFEFLGFTAAAAWGAITAPITLVVAGVAAVSFVVYQLVKNWENVKASVYDAMGATLEYVAKAAGVFSGEKAAALKSEAQSWRDKASAIRDAAKAEDEAAKSAAAAAAAEEERKRKKKQEDERAELERINGARSELARTNAEELVLIEQEKNLRLDEIESGYRSDQLAKRQAYEQQALQLQIDANLAKANLESDAAARKDAVEKAMFKASLDKAKLAAKQEEEIAKEKVQNQRDTLATFASLSTSGNKTLAAIGKAAALTQIAIDTEVAVSKAYTWGTGLGGPALGYAFGAIAATAMAARAANVAGIKFEDGGIVPGTSRNGDLVQARLNSGEMVLNKQQQAELFSMANGGGSGGGVREEIAALRQTVEGILRQPIQIAIDGRELINVTRAQLEAGRSFA